MQKNHNQQNSTCDTGDSDDCPFYIIRCNPISVFIILCLCRMLHPIPFPFTQQQTEQPEITYNELCTRIGTPKDIIIEYYKNADTEYVIQKLRISSIIRCIVISILLIAVVVASIELYSFHKLYKRAEDSIDGYVIERIHDETP